MAMTIREYLADWWAELRRGAAFAVTLFAACLVSMVVSYGVILHLTRAPKPALAPEVDALAIADQLRGFSNELLRLTSDYLDRRKNQGRLAPNEFHAWLEHEFRPRLNALRRRLLAWEQPAPPLGALLRAAEQLAATAAQPDLTSAGLAATEQVAEAATLTEEYISSLGLRGALSQPALVPRF